jgi:hypothetical protein
MVCHASGNYSTRGMTQSGPLSAKLFNILANAVARESLREFREGGNYKVWELDGLMLTFFLLCHFLRRRCVPCIQGHGIPTPRAGPLGRPV